MAANLENRCKDKILETNDFKGGKKIYVTEKELNQKLEGHQLQQVIREGKTLQRHFNNNKTLGIHLMLHAELKIMIPNQETKFQIVCFHFKNGDCFTLTDFQRQVTLTLNPVPPSVPDALLKSFTLTYFQTLLTKKNNHKKRVNGSAFDSGH